MTTSEREVERLIDRLSGWARGRLDVRAAALVGSWARDASGRDSDVDLVLLTDQPTLHTDADEWVKELGGVGLVKTRSWGASPSAGSRSRPASKWTSESAVLRGRESRPPTRVPAVS
jgi:predicted nucleotidyltransferase